MTVLYAQRHRADLSIAQAAHARYVALDELLAQSDFVVVQVPCTPQTHHLIGALATALEAGTIAGATLATCHAMVTQAVDNLIGGLEGRTPPDQINPAAPQRAVPTLP